MSLFRDSLRPPPFASDDAVRRYLEAIRAELEPDPLFRRRLRGVVVNRFVASREGIARPARTRASAMGRLGRACLYASVVLAMSVSGVMAVSQAALPGELLYPIKRQIEALRMETLPSEFHDDLAVYALAERVHELGRLADAGDWERVAAMAGTIGDGYAQVAALGVAAQGADGVLGSRMAVLDGLLGRLPPKARAAIQHVLDETPRAGHGAAEGNGNGDNPTPATNSGGANNAGTQPDGTTNNGGANNDGTNAPAGGVGPGEDASQTGGSGKGPKPSPGHGAHDDRSPNENANANAEGTGAPQPSPTP